MFPKEIKDILEKHQEHNREEVSKVNKYILEILNELETIKNNMSGEISDLYKNNIVGEQVSELHNEITTLVKYIKSIDYIIDNIDDGSKISINYVSNISPRQQELLQLFKDGIRPFLISDSLCPECHEEIVPFNIYYCRKLDDKIIEESVQWSRCPICRRWYVLDKWLKDFDLTNTNITLNRKYYSDVPTIGIYSIVVLSNTLHCSLNHKTKDIVANLPTINENGELIYVKINASYCYECDRFTILKNDFNNIKDVIICKIIDETYEYSSASKEEFEIEPKTSILYNYGYNVKAQSNLSEEQRHTILSAIIESGIMNKRDIVNHITTLIDRGSKISSWKSATHKWKQDREFVSQYQNGELPEFIFNEVILKHKLSI